MFPITASSTARVAGHRRRRPDGSPGPSSRLGDIVIETTWQGFQVYDFDPWAPVMTSRDIADASPYRCATSPLSPDE